MTGPRRVALEVSLACDGRCRFCAQRGLPRTHTHDATTDEAVQSAARAGKEITFVGGEPTLHPRLPTWVAAARDAGAPAVGVQTHGRALAEPARTAALVAAGLSDVHLSIHGAQPRVHDYHTQAPGSLAASLTGLHELARQAPHVQIAVSTVVTRSNFRDLAALASRLHAWGVTAWNLQWLHARGGADAAFDRLVPRLGMAAPFVLHAADAARRAGLPVFTTGLPACVLGPATHHALPGPARAHPAACRECVERPTCSGVSPRYTQRFGSRELRPRPNAAPMREAVRSAPRSRDQAGLRRMFVGPGALAPPREQPVAPSPSTARTRLAVLGRPDPGRDQARSRDPAAGAALQALFPDLFDSCGPQARKKRT